VTYRRPAKRVFTTFLLSGALEWKMWKWLLSWAKTLDSGSSLPSFHAIFMALLDQTVVPPASTPPTLESTSGSSTHLLTRLSQSSTSCEGEHGFSSLRPGTPVRHPQHSARFPCNKRSSSSVGWGEVAELRPILTLLPAYHAWSSDPAHTLESSNLGESRRSTSR
jgi:hypothetical protein